MRRLFLFSLRKILYAFSLTALLLFPSLIETPPFAEAVTIKGKRLAEISDIVSTVTDSDFPEIPKHSLMLFERIRLDSNHMRYQSHVFTIGSDGSLKKENATLDNYDSDYLPLSSSLDVIQRMDVSVSPKRFGMRRNIMYATAGLDDYYSRYGLQTLESVGTEDSAQISQIASDYDYTNSERDSWGSACLSVEGMEDRDVFVVAHSSKMGISGNLCFKFLQVSRNETGDNGMINDLNVDGGDGSQYEVFGYGTGNLGCTIAAGDIDGDGYRNEIALAWTQNDGSWIYVFQVKKSGDSVKVTKLLEDCCNNSDGHNGEEYWMGYRQACPNIVTGDFDGDGRDEPAFVGRVYYYGTNYMRVHVYDYNPDNGRWNNEYEQFNVTPGVSGSEGAEAACKAARCDFDGDGKDEIAVLLFPEYRAGTAHPRLERWYCDNGSITPKRDTSHRKGGPGDTSLLGYPVVFNNDYYLVNEDFSITAGPLTGTRGKAKLAEDVAISHVNSNRSSVYVIPTRLDSNREFAGFGETKTIFNVEDSSEGRRGGLVTSDFANETLMLDKPTHVQDEHDESYVALLEALPYHVDNVGTDGKLADHPINYTFSGFGDMADGIKGDMSVRYITRKSESEQKDVSFGLASTTETVSMLGKAGPYVSGYLKFRATEANIAGNFDPRIKAAAGAYESLMNFVTDKINTTTTNSQSYANSATVSTTMEAKQYDGFITYTAPQHIWRYRILNDPLPSWYVLGPKADYVSGDYSGVESQSHHLTFSMYDDATPATTYSNQHYAYQARHEEGNFFSYPSTVEDIEGYSSGGALVSAPYRAQWAKNEVGMTISFDQSQIDSQKYDENIQKSQLTKTVSAIASFFGAKDPSPLPPYTSHSESFVKKYSSQEGIEIKVYGRTTLHGEDAAHRIIAMPFTAREGAMTVGTAVELLEVGEPYGPALWWTNGLYGQHADPSLVLPRKWVMNGAELHANIQQYASMGRGIRYYVPSLKLDSDNSILGGLEYEISIPIYNASFVDTGEFDVSLSYVIRESFDISAPRSTMGNLNHIQTVTMSLGGWQNGSRLNKGWAKFKWDVPANLDDGQYYFYVQIDPDHKLKEVHESRVGDDGKIADVGGNNEAYYVFNYSSPGALEAKQNRQASASFKAAAHTGNGTILRTAYRSGDSESGVNSAMSIYDTTGTVSVKAKVEGYDDAIDILYLLSFIEDIAGTGSRDSFPVECELEYTGDEYYPEAYFYGVNYKPGALEAVNNDYSNVSDDAVSGYFMVDKLMLVPGKTVKFMLELHPDQVDWINGSGFELVVPELTAAKIIQSDDVDGNNSNGNNSNNSNSNSGGNNSNGGGSENITVLPSSSGGCETGAGIFAFLVLAGSLIFRKTNR